MRRSPALFRVSLGFALATLLVAPRSGRAAPTALSDDGRAGIVTAAQGVAMVRPIGRERWTPLDPRGLVFPGDVLRTEARGANVLDIRLKAGGRLVVGPGSVVELIAGLTDGTAVRLLRGDLEVTGSEQAPVHVRQTESFQRDVKTTTWLRVWETATIELPAAPKWLAGYRASTSEEWMGSLLATVDGKNVPLTVGYHKVVAEIRDQIARTTVEESFVNSTDATLEGVFSFPLPADASISGFGMWIGDELVEADLVEKQRARAIYEDILRRKKDPGLLEWDGGNLFKARVFPIFPHSEKRIRLRYTEVLPLEGDAYRYRYALRSELLRLHPLRELSIAVNVVSAATLKDVSSPTHSVTLRKTEHEAVAEFGAQQYTPERDFELSIGVGRGDGLSTLAHVRGEDGFFMLLLSPPDATPGGWQRELAPEGDPLDLVLVADTSGSMDPASRATQAQFLAALLGQLSSKDRFRLIACDVEPHDLVAEPTSVTEENVAKALALLDARFSLGWTDLDKAFDAVLGKAGPGTHVIYVGDGIPTSAAADPIATVDRLKTKAKAKDTKAVFHAVSTSSAYEKGVLTGIASIGGGSFRRADDGPVANSKALLAEIARPGLRDAKVTIEGVATARVYPEVWPNLPLGSQQVVLGRFLPGANAKTANVVVTGSVAGKPVRYTSLFVVPAADEGNSFLPRLWARRHLDVLLAQGQNQGTKDEIVAFSREYQIMTPYTSFLVLENDEDRALYGVERTVKMRDAERFFAQARDQATLEIARKQMETAHRWRIDLRREILRDISTLGRGLPVPAAVTWGGDEGRWVVVDGRRMGFGGGAGGRFRGPAGGVPGGLTSRYEYDFEIAQEGGKYDTTTGSTELLGLSNEGDGIRATQQISEATATVACCPAPPSTREPSDPLAPYSDADANGSIDMEEVTNGKDDRAAGEGDSGVDFSRISLRGSNFKPRGRSEFRGIGGFDSGEEGGAASGWLRGQSARSQGFGPWRQPNWNAGHCGFPGVGRPPRLPPPFPDPTWDRVVLKAMKSLDRRGALAAMTGAVRVTSDDRVLHALRGHLEWHRRTTALVAAHRWHVASDGFEEGRTESWLSETERGVVDDVVRLGRRRSATDADRSVAPPLSLGDYSLEDLVRRYARAYRHAPTLSQAGDLLTITFVADRDPKVQVVLVIDVARSVLVEEREVFDGKSTGTLRLTDFVEVAGRYWATKVERTDEDGHLVHRQTIAVEALDAPAFDAAWKAAIDAMSDVVFLGAEEPSLLVSQQAIHDGHADFAHHLVAALDHGSRGRFDDAWKAWALAEAMIMGKPGVAWLRLPLLERSRRGDELRSHAMTMAADIAKSDAPLARARAARLDGHPTSLGHRERLAIVDAVKSVWGRAGEDAELWSVFGRRREAAALASAGFWDRAGAVLAALASERPFDATDVLARATNLRQGEDLAAAAAYTGERATKGGPWTISEVDRLFPAWVNWLWELRDVPALAAAADAWIQANPRNETAYLVQVSCLYFRGRYADADRWVLERLKSGAAGSGDSAVRAARIAAIDVALGRGWAFNAQAIPALWRPALGELALALARSDAPDGDFATMIVGDGRFQQTDEARVLAETLQKDLAADGAIAAMPIPRLVRTVGWAHRAAGDAIWKAIVDGVVARWRTTTDATDADTLANLILESLPTGGRNEERIVTLRERLREQLAKSIGRSANGVAAQLFGTILSSPYEAAREDEAFGLLAALSGVDAESDLDPETLVHRQRAQAAGDTRKLAAWVFQGRYLAALGQPEDRSKWTRAETVQKMKEARTKAQGETAARLEAAVAAASSDAHVRPWLEVERMGYAAETQADLSKSERDATAALGVIPVPGPTADADVDMLLAERCAAVLAFAATRRTAPAGLSDRVVQYFDARVALDPIEKGGGLLDDRSEVFRLRVALDRPAELEKSLVAWTKPDRVDNRWRIALAYLLAETNRLREAVTTLEAAAAQGDLDAAAWKLMADGYLVLKEDVRRDDALDHRMALLYEWQLGQQVWQEASRVGRQGEGVPSELDPEMLRVLRFLLRKSLTPSNYVQHVLGLYRPTKDFRVLECLADGVPGHSPEAVYEYLQQATTVVGEIHEEATCDALFERLASVLADPTKTTNEVDRRALRLLLVSVESRAAAVPKSDPRHGERAFAALRSAFEGALVAGERVLLARQLSSLGATASLALAEEQMKRLEELLAGSTEGAVERLLVGRHLAQVLWDRGRKDDAADRLVSLLDAARSSADGTLSWDSNEAYSALISWWAAMGHFRQAEARLRQDLEREPRSQRKEALRMRLFALYATALVRGAATALGSNGDLFRSAADEMERYLAGGPAYLVSTAAESHGLLHEAAKKSNAIPDTAEVYFAFVKERLPKALLRNPMAALDVYQHVLQRLRNVAGPLPPLDVTVDLLAREPEWIERVGLGVWPRFSGWMADWRREVGNVGALEQPLLAIVLRRLEIALSMRTWDGSGFWREDYNDFWREHKSDFAAVALRVAELNAGKPAVALHVAEYQRTGLRLHPEAIATLQMILANGHDPEDVRSRLANWLREDRRYAEAWPVVEKLVADRPDNLDYRILASAVLYGLGRGQECLRVLSETAARWKEKKTWSAEVAAAVATAAVDAALATSGATWMDDALRLRREAGGLGREDAVLAQWYQTLARARSLLGETDAAIRASSAAIVAWGRDQSQRDEALRRLRDVMASAKDLDAWVSRHDTEVATSGMDAPTIRKALGQVLLAKGRNDRAAAELRAARDLDPADLETHGLLVKALDAMGDAPGALEALLLSLRVAPKNLPAYGDLAARFFKVDRLDDAERARTSLVEAMPSDPDGYRTLAAIREANGKWDLAVVAWNGVIRTRPTEPAGWVSLAKAQGRSGDGEGVRRTIDHLRNTTWDARFGDVKAQVAKEFERVR